MTTRLVEQLKFSRSEFQRCFAGIPEEDGLKRLMPINSIGWMVAHLANQENAYWNYLGQGVKVHKELKKIAGYGKPATTPSLNEMWEIWTDVTKSADTYLDKLTEEDFSKFMEIRGKPVGESIGTMLMRNTYHYWFHMGEGYAVRQQLGHNKLPEFVGDMASIAY
jgi:uncharacterized damage-inducible protein DinB